jgi:uncharacterized membrane protein YedE/YeeE
MSVVAAAATHSIASVVWLLSAGNGARVQAAFLLPAWLLIGKGKKHPPPQARMIRSGQLALRWPNSYCQDCSQGSWGVFGRLSCAEWDQWMSAAWTVCVGLNQ